MVNRYPAGAQVMVYYDPNNPSDAAGTRHAGLHQVAVGGADIDRPVPVRDGGGHDVYVVNENLGVLQELRDFYVIVRALFRSNSLLYPFIALAR